MPTFEIDYMEDGKKQTEVFKGSSWRDAYLRVEQLQTEKDDSNQELEVVAVRIEENCYW